VTRRQMLNTGATVVLGVGGSGRLELGPADRPGSPYWNVTRVAVGTNRPGLAPVPSMSLYLDAEDETGLQDATYDGSRDGSDVDIDMQRGQRLIAVWTGGQAGDRAFLSVTGWKGEG
jgi:hypothetical protein